MRQLRVLLTVAALVLVVCVGAAGASAGAKHEPVKLNVLFVGAHPDDA